MTLSTPPSATFLATADDMRERIRRKSRLKGRQPEDAAMAEVAQLLGPRPRAGFRRDLLIEFLHRLNDHFGVLHDRHLVALARQLNLPMAEVYEVASFYHHFEIVRGNDAVAPRLVLRVCDSLSCSMAGARELLAALPERLRAAGQGDVQVQAVPCVGRCEQAPVAVVHQCPVPHATVDAVLETISLKANRALALHPQAPPAINFDIAALAEHSVPAQPDSVSPAHTDLATYRSHGGYQTAAALVNGEMDAEAVLAAMEDSGLRGLGGAGFPAGRKWRIVREQAALAERRAAPSEAATPSGGSGQGGSVRRSSSADCSSARQPWYSSRR